MAKTSQRAVATEKSQEWTITDSGVELTRFQEALANWAVAGSPSTLLRHERDSESEFDNFQIATIQSRDGLIFGYASYLKFDAGSLEDVLDADETGSFNAYTDKEGRHVPLSEIQHFDVFDEYTGRGGIIYINKIEVMTPRVGLGKMLLQHLTKCEESELLFCIQLKMQPRSSLNLDLSLLE